MQEETKTEYSQLRHRIKSRISEDIFNAMPENIRQELLNMGQEEIKEALLSDLLRLPWQQPKTVPDVDLVKAKYLLDRSHYAMFEVKEKVLRYMSCQKHLGKSYGAVLLLAGAPGVGKTTIAATIAAAMGRPCVKISLAGVSDSYFLRGAQQVYRNAHHGRIVEAVIQTQSFCPVILLDEIDKMGASQEHGSPENVLLDLLDSDRSWYVDNFLSMPLDLSDAIFIATANDLRPLSPVLKDRMDIVELPSYTFPDKERIVHGFIWPKLLKEYQLESLDSLHDVLADMDHPVAITKSLEITDEAVKLLISQCPEEGVRDLERLCRRLCEAVISLYYAKGILLGRIDEKNVKTLLEPIFYKVK